jgi:hypothetical protein
VTLRENTTIQWQIATITGRKLQWARASWEKEGHGMKAKDSYKGGHK